ncbi:MAG TPA: hypothetical protein PKN33_09765 [Phycisphaerae bacterium]|nr:hypothetical protein [Phycisphaerae bacterium]
MRWFDLKKESGWQSCDVATVKPLNTLEDARSGLKIREMKKK